MPEKYVIFNGLKFTRDEKTGYYLNATHMIRLHRYVWEYYNGAIPKGYHIHHKGHDKSNNDISNLELLTKAEHLSLHGKERDYEKQIAIMNHAREYANKWHGSEAGREWHRKHYEAMGSQMHQKAEFTCEYCGAKFIGEAKKTTRFCSNKCKSAWRRKAGLDNVERKCEYCGKTYITNKYSKSRFCSGTCSNRANPRLPQLRKNQEYNACG